MKKIFNSFLTVVLIAGVTLIPVFDVGVPASANESLLNSEEVLIDNLQRIEGDVFRSENDILDLTLNFETSVRNDFQLINSNSYDNNGILDLTLNPEATLIRGFQIVDGNIHDRNGILFIELDKDGFTSWGTRLAADFCILYAADIEEAIGFDIFNGTVSLEQYELTNLGESFMLSDSKQNVSVLYSSGSISGVNFGLTNTTRGTEHT